MDITCVDRFSASGVPLVLDRFGLALARGRIGHPLSTARGLLVGVAVASPLWWGIVAVLDRL